MTNMKEFESELEQSLKELGYEVEFKDVIKSTESYRGVSLVLGDDTKVSPTFKIGTLDGKVFDGVTVDKVVENILDWKENDSPIIGQIAVISDNILSFENIKDSIYPDIVSNTLRSDFVSRIPHTQMTDEFSIVYKIKLDNIQDGAVCFVNESIFKAWGVTIDEVDKIARENLENAEYSVRGLSEVLFEMTGLMPPMADDPMVYISNDTGVKGAVELINEKAIRDISDRMKTNGFCGNFVILPSSVHEVLAIPAEMYDDSMLDMVSEINNTEVIPEDKLSDTPIFCKVDKTIEYSDITDEKEEELDR